MPAAKAPKMLSNPKPSARTNNAASSNIDMRTGNCVLECIVRPSNASTIGGLAPMPTAAATPTIAKESKQEPDLLPGTILF